MFPPTSGSRSAPVNDSTEREFEDILNQLNALGSEIDQELSSKYKSKDSPTSPRKESEAQSFESPYHHHKYQRREMLLSNGTENGSYYSEEPPPPPEMIPGPNEVVQNVGDDSKPYYSPHLYHHHHHHSHHHHRPSLQDHHHYHHYSDSGQSLDSSTTGENALPVLEITSQLSQLRTDSPDNDSAFSDSISLISSEQSSSSSSSNSNKAPKISSNSSSTDNNSKPPQPPPSVSNSSSQVIVSASPNESNTPIKQQQLFLESSSIDSDKKDDSLGSLDAMILNESITTSKCKSFAQIDQILNGIDWDFFDGITQENSLSPDENETKEKGKNRCTEESINKIKPKLKSLSSPEEVIKEDKVEKEKAFDEKIREAMAKIREANIRKVFAEDNSAKSLLADERMTIGAICRQLAAKNYIQMGLDHCIIEHMPQLFLERFYEDHESLVENVLYWGRDHNNKLYFMPRSDKYDLFVQPEKYLISVSQPNENADTLKSGSLRAKYNANQLRSDLIAQFFSTGATVRVPEIEGSLYLRTDGKKSWKKYFFSLRASGLYYCPKGKPKSTKDLICLTTFELNCLYYGFGWKKKFKAPTEFGFAVKHPQIQSKSPKHIKYLCAESEEDFRLWMTGIRVAKYGRQLLENFEQFKLADSGEIDCEETLKNSESKKTTTFQPSTSDLTNGFAYYEGESPSHYQQSSILMRHTPRNESVRSSSASSSSGCMSEQSSVVSSTLSNVDSTGSNSNYHFTSPMHHPITHHHLQQSPLAFEADFPVGTIKRKPNVMLQPKIPLTNTTRNLALQSDDALLEVSDGSGGSCGASGDEAAYSGSSPSPDQFQRGSFKTGTLRRSSNTDERSIKSPSKMSLSMMQSPQHQVYTKTEEEEELPPPPPPMLKSAESTTSLNASFPPPPPEVLDQQSNLSNSISEPNTPLKQSPPQLSALPMPPMTPQPQPKFASFNHRLSRRLSDLSDNLPCLANFRSHYQESYLLPNSRASIATSSDSNTSFVSLKLNPRANRFQNRHMTLDHHQQNGHGQQWNKFGTSPRLRNFEPNCEVPPPPTPTSMFAPQSVSNVNGTYGSSHCAIVADSTSNLSSNGQAMTRPDYELPAKTSRVKVFAPYQPSSAPPTSIPPPPPESSHHQPQQQQQQPRESHYMSISPHLLQKHQQMMQRQQQQHEQSYPNGTYYNGHDNYHVPEEMFIKNMERVMQKKWHVAQMLRQDTTATPGGVLGFRDSAYLPPPVSQSMESSLQQIPFPPPPASLTSPYPHVYPNYSNSQYAAYNGGSSQPNSPFHNGYQHQKQVRIVEEPQVHYAPGSTCSTSSNSSLKKRPPPPPKRSDSTQLTSSSRLS